MRLRFNASSATHTAIPYEATSVGSGELLGALGLTRNGEPPAIDLVAPDDESPLQLRLAGTVTRLDRDSGLIAARDKSTDRAAMASIRRKANSPFASQLRQIVAGITGSRSARAMTHGIVVTSVGARAETSLVAAALAVTCAMTGYRVLLVDANLARPSMHKLFGVSNEVGLADLLNSVDPPNFLAQPTAIPNLAVVSAGSRAFDHASLLSRQRVRHRLDSIAASFDYMFIDASSLPPALLARLAADSEQVAIAVKRHHSSVADLEKMLRVLRQEGIDNTSVLVLD